MKKTLFVVACAALFLSACTSSSEKTEPAKSEPAATPVAPVEPAKSAPPAPEAAPAEPAKSEPAKREPSKVDAKSAPANKPLSLKEVNTLSGLKIIDIVEGEGNSVRTDNVIQVHYTGWLCGIL